MVASIRTERGRIISRAAELAEVKAAMKPGVKVAAVLMSGKGRLIQGRVAAIEGGKVKLDGQAELIDPRDVCAIVTDDEGAIHDRETTTN
jgi:hypothetical protein